jgi:L-aspartate oxidase
VILATGGGGQVFAQTTNPVISTGDGVAIAHRAGALLRDLEFVQFHPTALTLPGAPRFLISEAVRGEGAHLVDKTGHRFAFDYDPAGELAPRDVVSRAIFNHLQKTEADPAAANVWLDLRSIPTETVQHRFPNIIQVCQKWGVDVLTQPIPVAPAAHYWMGGVYTDIQGQTTIPNLYAVGETASTGVHGANRLASNSLLECLVFGAQFSQLALPEAAISPALSSPRAFTLSPKDLNWIEQIRQDLPKLVWQGAGISREAMLLTSSIAQVESWQEEFEQLPSTRLLRNCLPPQTWQLQPEQFAQVQAWSELRNLLEVAELLLKSANFRSESRGGHYRSDYPETQPDWQIHTLIQAKQWSKGSVDLQP